MEILELLAKGFLEYGAIGLLALAGWVVSGWFFYRDFKKKDGRNAVLKAKDEELAQARKDLNDEKDGHRKTIEDQTDKRLEDAKEMIDDYNELATNVNHTVDKLALALEVKVR